MKEKTHNFFRWPSMRRLRIFIASVILSIIFTFSVDANGPECTGVNRWPTMMAFTHLKNAGVIDNEIIDFSKTIVIRLASEKLGNNLYRQIHLITFVDKTGNRIQVITSNEASLEECSMSGVEVYLIRQCFP